MGVLSLVLAIVLFGAWCFVWAVCLLGWRTAKIRYGSKSIPSRLSTLPAAAVPGVSIIRPLCGLDSNMYTTLESVMKLEYPAFEVLFAVQDEKDEALPVVRMVMEKYPSVPARIIISASTMNYRADGLLDPKNVGVNPKINNLMAPFAEAKYDLLWVLDVTIAVTPGTLGRAVDAFLDTPRLDIESSPLMGDEMRHPPARGDVGLVHQVPFAVIYQKSWGSLIEQAYLNSTHAKMYLAIVSLFYSDPRGRAHDAKNATKVDSCVVGKSNLYSRSNITSLATPSPTLRRLPSPPAGLEGFGPFLAEDNMIALGLWHQQGLQHAMTSDVALDFLSAMSIRGYFNRRVRWIRVRKRMTLPATLAEPFTESIICGLYGSWAIARLIGGTIVSLFVLHMAVWLLVDLSVRRSLSTNVKQIGPPASTAVFIAAWAARELMALPIWLYAMLGNNVVWRGQKYRIINSGEAVQDDSA